MLLIGNYKLKPSVMSNMYKKTIASLVSIWISWNNYTLFLAMQNLASLIEYSMECPQKITTAL